MSYGTIAAVLPDAFTIAVLAAIESLLSAVVADEMIGARHNSNMELVAQGARDRPTTMATTRSKATVRKKVTASTAMSLLGERLITFTTVRHPLIL